LVFAFSIAQKGIEVKAIIIYRFREGGSNVVAPPLAGATTKRVGGQVKINSPLRREREIGQAKRMKGKNFLLRRFTAEKFSCIIRA
jgi:hypothetical protein